MSSTGIFGFSGPEAASRALGAVAAGIVAGVLLLAGLSIWQLRMQAEETARENLESAAFALAAHANQVFASADYVLNGIVEAVANERIGDLTTFKRRFADEATHAMLRTRAQGFRAFDVLSMVASDGDLVSYSRGFPSPSMNIREREGVASPPIAADRLQITAPRVAIANGRWTFYLVRRLETPDGRLLGIVQAGIGTAYFADFYQRVQTTPRGHSGKDNTLAALLRDDMTILATAPSDDSRLGQPIAMHEGLLTAVRMVEGYPARVAVAVSDDAYLAAWRAQAAVVAGFAVLASAMLTLTFVLLVRLLRRREQELVADRRLRLQAEAADRAKTEFLSTVTHELRTPMNGVLGTAELLLRERRPERQHELVQTLIGSGRALLGIINDILDLTKIEAGDLAVRRFAFSPAAVAEEVHGLFTAAAQRKGLSLLLVQQPGVQPAALGDAGHIRQVLVHLVSNALKFTDEGTIEIAVASRPAATAGRVTLRYDVTDSGIGIPEDARPQLFHPFAQVDASAQRRHGGAGLGLALAQRLVRLIGGRIDFANLPGGGTRFWFEVELDPAEGAPQPEATVQEDAAVRFAHSGVAPLEPLQPSAPAEPATTHVLVVEDNPVNAMIVQEQLAALGCTSDLAEDGEAALKRLHGASYHLVLMDCMLPKLSGYDATILWRAVEEIEGRVRLPIVALTANTLASNAELCQQAGMDDFVTKPLTTERLGTVLRKWTAHAGTAL